MKSSTDPPSAGRTAAVLARVLAVAAWLAAACLFPRQAPAAPDSASRGRPPAAAPPLEGELLVHRFDFPDRSELRHGLRLASGEVRWLRLDPRAAAELQPGTRLRVWLAAPAGSADEPLPVRQHLVLAAPRSSRALGLPLAPAGEATRRRWAFILVDIGRGTNLDRDEAQTLLFSERPGSVRSYYRESSYGREELEGEVFGPFRVQVSEPARLCAQSVFLGLAEQLLPAVPGQFDQYLWYFGSDIPGCGWGGVAVQGRASDPARDSFYNAASSCVVLIQEPGHNFGMVHSSALRCTRDGVPVSFVEPGAGYCVHDEYGNPFDPMGGAGGAVGGSDPPACLHMNGVQKAYQGWLSGCNVVEATSSGTFTLLPLEPHCHGLQLLRIPLPRPRALRLVTGPGATLDQALVTAYYLELRTPLGLDRPIRRPQVFLLAAGEPRAAVETGPPNWLIDATPRTPTVLDAALVVGQPYVDPAPDGPRITVLSVEGTRAVVRVELGGAAAEPRRAEQAGEGRCADARPFADPGPAPASCQLVGPASDDQDQGEDDLGDDDPTPPTDPIDPTDPTRDPGPSTAQSGPTLSACGCALGARRADAPWASALGVLVVVALALRGRRTAP